MKLATIAIILFATSAFADTDHMAQTICGLIQKNPQFNYSEIFEKSDAIPPKGTVTSAFKLAFSQHGACLRIQRLSQNSQVTSYFLELVDGFRTDLLIGLNGDGLVSRYFMGGDLPPSNMVEMREIMVPMRDGARLRTLVFQLNDRKKKPTIVVRTPYLTRSYGLIAYANTYSLYGLDHDIKNGYTYVIQAVRGTAGSGGTLKYFGGPQEASDGYDTIEWAAKQDFSTGAVAIMGGSYVGFTAISAATANPPHLKLVIAGSYPHTANNNAADSGALSLFGLQWLRWVTLGQGTKPAGMILPATVNERLLQVSDIRKYDSIAFGVTIPEWQNLANNYSTFNTPFWKERSILEDLPKIHIPTYHLSGTQIDDDSTDTMHAFEYLEKYGSITNHHLIIGHWPHPAVPSKVPYLRARADRWLAHYLKGEPLVAEPVVQMTTEANPESITFISGNKYPLPQLRTETLYLDSKLTGARPASEKKFSFTMDPSSNNGDLCTSTSLPQNTTANFTKIFDKQEIIMGDIDLNAFVSINSAQTDLFMTVRKSNLDGHVDCLGRWGTRVTRSSGPTRVELSIGPILAQFSPGEKLELVLTNNYFPMTVRNTNSDVWRYFDKILPSTVTVVTSPSRPSFVRVTYKKNGMRTTGSHQSNLVARPPTGNGGATKGTD